MAGEEISGILIIDKPAGMTSHDVVDAVRRILHLRQVGHFGTLDPFATGVLPLSLCKATRFAQFYLKSRKAYEGTIRFGVTTDTYDSTGKVSAEPVAVKLDPAKLEKLFQKFTGRILQTPPPYSAKRVGGTRAYKLARRNLPVKLIPVEVEIYALELLGIEGDTARFAVECSGGTYVRSMAHDMGQELGWGAYLAGLRRTAVAEFNGNQAITLEQLDLTAREGRVKDCLVPLEALLPGCPELLVRGREEVNVRHGHSFQLPHALRAGRGTPAGEAPPVSLLKVMNPERRLIAIARHVSGKIYHPELVLA